MYDIRDNIRRPTARHPTKLVYPIHELKVDQSFLFPIGKIKGVRSSARYWATKGGKKFIVFRYSESEGACMRIE